MPRDPPVTSATFPVKFVMSLLSIERSSRASAPPQRSTPDRRHGLALAREVVLGACRVDENAPTCSRLLVRAEKATENSASGASSPGRLSWTGGGLTAVRA